MLFSNNKLTRDELLSRFFPHYHPVASLSQSDLSGGSVIISNGDRRHVLRQPHDPSAATYYFRRQYRALRRLPARLAPTPAVLLTLLDGGGVLRRGGEKRLTGLPRSCQAYCMICISNRGLAGGLASHHCWPSTGRGAIRRGASRVGCAGISGCAARASPVPSGWRRCTWTSMPAILFIMSPA